MNRTDGFYVDTKGAGDSSDRLHGNCHNSERGTGCEAGSPVPSLPIATGNRSAYARVADESSRPPEVVQIGRDGVISASCSTDAQRPTDKFAWAVFVPWLSASSRVFSARCNICAYATMSMSVCLSVTEVHWRMIANLGFKFWSQFTAHCGRGACGREGRNHHRE